MTLRSDLATEIEKALTDEVYDGGFGYMGDEQFVTYVRTLSETAANVARDFPDRFAGVAGEVIAEVERSIAKHGEQRHLPMGTGADTRPLTARAVELGSLHAPGLWPGMTARHLARIATLDTKSHSANEGGDDTCTWWHILREEVLEAAAEDDATALRDELVQVAAVAVKMIDALDAGAPVAEEGRDG